MHVLVKAELLGERGLHVPPLFVSGTTIELNRQRASCPLGKAGRVFGERVRRAFEAWTPLAAEGDVSYNRPMSTHMSD